MDKNLALEQMAAALRSAEFALVSSGYDLSSCDATGLNIPLREQIETALTAYRFAIFEETAPRKRSASRCPDCGEAGEIKGHMTCQYPQD